MREREFHLRCSRRFLCLLIIFFLCSDVMVLLLSVKASIKAAILLLAGAYFIYLLRQHGLLINKSSILGFNFVQNGWRINTRQGVYPAKLCNDSTATDAAMMLRFQVQGHLTRWSCLIMRDSLASERYHELMVLLRLITILD